MTRTFTTCPTVEKTWRNLSSVVELLTFPMKICHFESPDMVAGWLGWLRLVECNVVPVGWEDKETGEARVGLLVCWLPGSDGLGHFLWWLLCEWKDDEGNVRVV